MKWFIHFLTILEIYHIDCYQLIGNLRDVNNSLEVINPRSFLIFPGTKWCGEGNIADNEDDLGVFADTDKCCRTHDMCPETIAGYETKHNLTNPNFFTRLPCDCDLKFHDCLKNADSEVSKKIGILYFDIIGTQCYKEDYPIIKCASYTNFLHLKCSNYTLDETKEKVYQFFDVPDF
ncbi:phospholipase A2-like [Coccinella septempunctata]|uniref:phospholipase A2-like n=1 Tax=Coccinella septempunctata TaxID=41139 RepID=UPI001D096F41|nr:phospholipase A2-like [Coccinella septempunctata]